MNDLLRDTAMHALAEKLLKRSTHLLEKESPAAEARFSKHSMKASRAHILSTQHTVA